MYLRIYPSSLSLSVCQGALYFNVVFMLFNTGIAATEETTPSQPLSTSSSMSSSPSSTAMEGGGSADDVSSTDGPVIAGVVLAVVFTIVLLSVVLVVAAIICCKIRVLKKYNIETHSRHNGELVPCTYPPLMHMQYL